MTIHFGNVPAVSVLYIPFTSYNSAGASVTLTGLATSDIKIYKNGSTTERNSTSGYTLLDTDGIDFDGVTGLHGFSIDLDDDTDAGFFAVGSQYWVVVSTVTIDGQTVTLLAATFRMVAEETTPGAPASNVVSFGGTATNDLAASLLDGVTMTESYAADGSEMTLAQALYALVQYNNDRAISGTTMTVKKLDGTTAAITLTIDDATNPTTVQRTA